MKFGRLYGILDLGYVRPADVSRVTKELVAGGIDILQLRAKAYSAEQVVGIAEQMLPITRAAAVPLVINDHPRAAAKLGAEGVHVGQGDDAIAKARDLVGPGCFIGKSTHSLAQAAAAVAEGADYIGFGPLYATGTKPDYTPIGLQDISAVHQRVPIPIFCIGGVNESRIDDVLGAGATRVVVVSAFLLAPDIARAVRDFKTRLVG